MTVSLGGLFSEFFHRNYRDQFATVTRTITVTSTTAARLVFDHSEVEAKAASSSTTSC